MTLRIVTADERLSTANNKTSLAIFGPPGVGKTSLLRTLPPDRSLCLDLEAGLKSVQDWPGASISIRSYTDFQDIVVLLAGPDLAVEPTKWYSVQHFEHVQKTYAGTGIPEFLNSKSIIFVDSITDLTRQAMVFAQQSPEAFSDRTGKPDTRGAYGLLARDVIRALKHLQHAPGKTVIFVGVLEKVVDEFNTVTFRPQMEGAKTGRELPGIVDQVISMQYFARDAQGEYTLNEKASERRLVCRSGNPWGLPAKDRSGNLDLTEPPDLSALLAKINRTSLH
jgi:AAA domain-containing protein